MNRKFFELKKEKQDRMINAALKIFAVQGYRHASTDDIVREAAISKGLLFHYFENKLGVYSFVYDYSVRYIGLEMRSMVNGRERDLFEILKQTERVRMNAMRGYPYMQQFLERTATEDVSEALSTIEEKGGPLEEIYREINARIDYTLLPEGVDGERLHKMLAFTIKGLMRERLESASFQPEMLDEEICDYLEMVRKLVYREGR